jgi:hypothetical protein
LKKELNKIYLLNFGQIFEFLQIQENCCSFELTQKKLRKRKWFTVRLGWLRPTATVLQTTAQPLAGQQKGQRRPTASCRSRRAALVLAARLG